MSSFPSKLKILYLRDYLLLNTDEKHPATMDDILRHLDTLGIHAERKSIYRDLECLGSDKGCYGLDIVSNNGKYYVRNRAFSPEEVRLLADMVQSSSFITKAKTESLVSKLEKQTSRFEAMKLRRTIHVHNRVKSMNESVYLNIDKISEAMYENRAISFQYIAHNLKKEKICKYNGKEYVVSPFSLISGENTYLMIGYSHEHNELRMYRVDKMKDISVMTIPRSGNSLFETAIDNEATSKMFHMFTGELVNVKMRFLNELLDCVIDRFGRDIAVIPDGEEHFTFIAEVAVSSQFYSWIAGFSGRAEIVDPEIVRNGMREFLLSSLCLYQQD